MFWIAFTNGQKQGGFCVKEKVGVCQICGKEIYCLDGFLNGVVKGNGTLSCFECDEKEKGRKATKVYEG